MTGVDTVYVQHCFAENHYGASRLQKWAEGQAGLQYPIPFTTVTDLGMDTGPSQANLGVLPLKKKKKNGRIA